MSKAITQTRIEELKLLGYRVEDMGQEWGDKFDGEFRWLNANGEFQDDFTSPLAVAAWERADSYHTQCQGA